MRAQLQHQLLLGFQTLDLFRASRAHVRKLGGSACSQRGCCVERSLHAVSLVGRLLQSLVRTARIVQCACKLVGLQVCQTFPAREFVACASRAAQHPAPRPHQRGLFLRGRGHGLSMRRALVVKLLCQLFTPSIEA